MEARGFTVAIAESVAQGMARAREHPPAYAVVDLKLEDGSGLDVVESAARCETGCARRRAHRIWQYRDRGRGGEIWRRSITFRNPPMRTISCRRCSRRLVTNREPPENPMSADRVRWEHIQRVYELCGHNVSETARRLNMHRRTLQRILAKRSPR